MPPALPLLRRALGAAFLSSAVFLTSACGGGGSASGPTSDPAAVTLKSISIEPALPSLGAGFSVQMDAYGVYSNGTKQKISSSVAWASSATSVATISSAGLASGVTAGASTISASLSGVSGSTTLTVSAATLSSLRLDPATFTLAKGTTQQMTATGVFSDYSEQDFTATSTWTSSDTGIATVDANGLVTAVAQGTATITAANSGLSTGTAVTVTSAALSSIAVAPATFKLPAGFSCAFTATGTFTDGTTQDLTNQAAWSSSATGVATVNDTAPTKGIASGVSAGSATLTATVGSVSGTAALTVSSASLSSITLAPTGFTLAIGFDQQMSATGAFSDGTTLDITAQAGWTSSSPAVATVGNSLDTSGDVIAVSAGTVTITAQVGSVSASTTVTVNGATLSSIALTPANPTVKAGKTQQFTATATFSDGSTKNVTQSCSWFSSSASVATVTTSHRRGKARCLTAGTTTITAVKPLASGPISGSTVLTVAP